AWRSSTITDSLSSEESREITNVSASRLVSVRASSSTLGSVVGVFRETAGHVSTQSRPDAAAASVARPGRRRRELARERDRLPVHRHLPAQRARDLVRRGRPGAFGGSGCGARGRFWRRDDRRPLRRAEHVAARPPPTSGLVRALPADSRGLASRSAARTRGGGHRLLLAGTVDVALAPDPTGPHPLGLRAAA